MTIESEGLPRSIEMGNKDMLSYKNILVPVDGSQQAEKALDKAIRVALLNNAHLLIVHVIDERAYGRMLDFHNAVMKEAAEAMEGTMQQYKQRALDAGLTNVEYKIEFGDPKHLIAGDLLTDNEIDLLVIGATGRGAVERVLLGSVTEYVTRKTTVDTIVAR
jgi:nucleotide-binding universal stress UspA family protein